MLFRSVAATKAAQTEADALKKSLQVASDELVATKKKVGEQAGELKKAGDLVTKKDEEVKAALEKAAKEKADKEKADKEKAAPKAEDKPADDAK